MFIDKQDNKLKEHYSKMLEIIGSLSRLFSESDSPFIYYRAAENLFCKSFNADNHSRSDTSADATLGNIGFGIKTFLKGNGKKMEKVAEFNNDSAQFRHMPPEKQVQEIIRLRNERIQTTAKIYGLDNMIYHCVTRTQGKIQIFEEPMNFIDEPTVKIKNASDKSIAFTDKFENYSFNISKSTLFKGFVIDNVLMEIPVTIIKDPFLALEKLFDTASKEIRELVFKPIDTSRERVFLPLYSTRDGEVPEKSGLNQWNAGGRARSMGEVYIPIPSWIHKQFPGFFPPKDQQFKLFLPDKKELNAKVCQEGNKALMTNPNETLGQWILRDVLGLKEGELLTYKKLEDIGLDSVVIYKKDDGDYEIDFAKIGSYDGFESNSSN